MAEVATLFADLILRTAGFQTGLNAAVASATQAGQQMSAAFGNAPQRAILNTGRALNTLAGSMNNSLGSRPQRAIADTTTALNELGSNMVASLGSRPQRAINETESSFSRMASSMSNRFANVANVVSGILISQAFYKILTSVQDASDAVLEFSKNLEQSAISFSIMLGSGEKAQRFLEELKTFAATTPFSFETARDASQRLLAMGFAAESVIPTMRTLSDATAVMGASKEKMDRIVLALGQMKTNGKIAGQEIRQLAEAGIPAYTILQEELGLTSDQIKNIGKMKISGDLGVEAILRGMQKRFGGAADQISKTLGGLQSTVKDDMLIISEVIFRGPYNALKKVTSTFVNFLENARKIVNTSGLGGLFESIVPPRLQTTIRIIIAAFQSLAGTLVIVWQALKPVVLLAGEYLVRAFALVAPIVLGVARAIALLAQFLTGSTQALKVFGGAIIALMVASTVTSILVKFATAIKLVAIAEFVSVAVMKLVAAVRFLTLAMMTNPIIAVVTIVSAALIELALSSETASKWLDALMAKLGALAGMKTGGLLEPTAVSDINKDMDEFNKSLIDTSKDLTGVGKGAADAKKGTDKWLASFDEVYSIPEKLGDVSDAITGVGDFKIPEIKLGKTPEVVPTDSLIAKAKKDWEDFIGVLVFPPIEPPVIPPINPAPAVNSMAMVGESIDAVAARSPVIIEIPAPSYSPFITALDATLLGIVGFAAASKLAMSNWMIDTQTAFTNWKTNTLATFAEWQTSCSNSIMQALSLTSSNIAIWSTNTSKLISDWILSTTNSIGTWGTAFVGGIITPLATTWSALYTWSVNGQVELSNWATLTNQTIGAWGANFISNITTPLATTWSALYTWSVNGQNELSNWLMLTGKTVLAWGSTLIKSITTPLAATWSALYAWSVNSQVEFSNWVVLTGATIGTWVTDTAGNIANWVTTTSGNIASWVTSATTNTQTFATTSYGWIALFCSNSWSSFKSFFSATSDSVAKWSTSLVQSISDFASSAWTKLSDLAVSVGGSIASKVESTVGSIKSTYQGLGDWVETNKGWIVPAALGAVAATGVAVAAAVTAPVTVPVAAVVATTAAATAATTAATTSAAAAVAELAAAAALIGGVLLPKVKDLLGGIGGGTPAVQGYATGGIVTRNQLVQVAEGNKREAIIPLESGMAPFARAVASELSNMSGSQGSNDSRPILYVANLIADDRGLKELERRMEIVRIQESQRKGQA